MSLTLTADFEEGTDGTTVTTASGASSVTGTPTYSSAAARHGLLGCVCDGTSDIVDFTVSTSGRASVYARMDAKTSTTGLIVGLLAGSTYQARVRIGGATANLSIADSGSAQKAVTSAVISSSSWFRLDFTWTQTGTSLDLQIDYFASPESSTPTETLHPTAFTALSSITRFRLTIGTASWQMSYDTLRLYSSTSDTINPYQASISISDTGSGSDSLAVAAAVPVSDTGSGADALSVSVGRSVSDTGSGADQLAVQAQVPNTDTGSGADTVTVAAAIPVADTAAGSDTLAVAGTIPVSDTAAGADSLAVTAAVAMTDTGSGADDTSVTATATLTDTGTGTDSAPAVSAAVTLPESATVDDQLGLTSGVTLPGETVTGTDAITAGIFVALPGDTGSGTDDISTALYVPPAGPVITVSLEEVHGSSEVLLYVAVDGALYAELDTVDGDTDVELTAPVGPVLLETIEGRTDIFLGIRGDYDVLLDPIDGRTVVVLRSRPDLSDNPPITLSLLAFADLVPLQGSSW